MNGDRDDLIRLVGLAHDATQHLPDTTSAVQLYLDAARAAEARFPGPIGVAVAGVLAIAAETRRVNRLGGNLGEHRTTIALALAVLDDAPPRHLPVSTLPRPHTACPTCGTPPTGGTQWRTS